MINIRRKYPDLVVATMLCLFSPVVKAVLFEPGVGVGIQYTDNATLAHTDKVNDVITSGYVGARLSEDEGTLIYNVGGLFNNQSYTQDTYPDTRYLNLDASINWAMIKDRFNWFLGDTFRQQTVNTLDPNTPDNLQDTNAFSFGADIRWPVSSRQNFSLVPSYSHFYYEFQDTDNQQSSVALNWDYQMFRLTRVGLYLAARYIDYDEQDFADIEFTSASFTVSGTRRRFDFSLDLGATNVKRDTGEDETGFSGGASFMAGLSSRSSFRAAASTGLTDTSNVALSSTDDIPGSGSTVQVTTDVVRNSVVNFSYLRDDATLRSSLIAAYQEITYSDSPLDQVIKSLGGRMDYPLSRLLIGTAYVNYYRTKWLDTERLDDRYVIGGYLNYSFSRKLRGVFDLSYRNNDSTSVTYNYDEYSVFASLVYGFGSVPRPSRTGGF